MNLDENLKMLILAFKDENRLQSAGFPVFKVHVNPGSYQRKTNISYSTKSTPGLPCSGGGSNEYHKTSAEEISFEFLLDRTGALGNFPTGDLGITVDIELFKKVALDYNGDIHRPHYLKLIWGTLIFDCQLKSLDIEYKMFSPLGFPIRAVLKTVFVEQTGKAKAELKNITNSPDLTHVRTVKAGDTLPLLTWEIYGNSKYYIEVARFNNLQNFRNLKPGDQIIFPPLKN